MRIFLVMMIGMVTFLNFNQTLARSPKNLNPLVLGLTHSRAKSYNNNVFISQLDSSVGDAMVESLREIRDGYLLSLNIGTPPQTIQVYMDTGSDLTWVPCGSNLSFDCMDCDEYRNYKLMDTFSPSRSSSSVRDTCASSFCTDLHSSDTFLDPCTVAGCSLSTLLKGTCSRPCPSFAYTYGEGGVVTGMLTKDTLRVHGSSDTIFIREVPKFRFGCVGSTYKEPIGIAGFGRGPLSIPSQLGFLNKGFSHCFLPFKYANNPNITSPLVLGDAAISNTGDLMQFTPMMTNPMLPNYYYIGLEAISVGNISTISSTPVSLNLREFDSQGNGGMLIDSGTTYTHLPEPFYSQLLSILESMISYPRAKETEDRTGFDLCYMVPCPNNNLSAIDDQHEHMFPSITFHFLNNVSLVLPKKNKFYAMNAPSNSSVVKCLLFQSMQEGDYGPAGIFGSFQQQDVHVVYDLENARVGFQPMDCASNAAFK